MNGTPEQYRSFYRERVPLSHSALMLETQAILGFGVENIAPNLTLPSSFWIGLQELIQKLAKSSLKSVQKLEAKVAAEKLLSAFGTVTTAPTIEPHNELSQRVLETQENLQLTLSESKFIFATLIQKIEQMIRDYHEAQLAVLPTEEEDEQVANYLQKSDAGGHRVITESISESNRAFSPMERKRKQKRKKIRRSYLIWMQRVKQIKQMIFEGNSSMQTELNLSAA